MKNFERKKGDILSKLNCFYCWRKLTHSEIFLNGNYCFVCKLKNADKLPPVNLPPKK
jgi:hypothetical protein